MLRDYQTECVDKIHTSLKHHRATLCVSPTGTGKTHIFSHLAAEWPARTLVIQHRDELIRQTAKHIARIVGEEPDIEQADLKADRCAVHRRSPVVIASVQTHHRRKSLNPYDFGLLISDEAHHATAKSWMGIIQRFQENPALKVVGFTATPDRVDNVALKRVFDDVAFKYEIQDAIEDGWLVPLTQRFVKIEGLDYSKVRTSMGDLSPSQLEQIMSVEAMLQKIVVPTLKEADGRKTLAFFPGVASSELACDIFNRHSLGCARAISDKTPKEERRQIISDFKDNLFQVLCNVQIATEGFDDPEIAVVAMGRATKSRSLYAQMVGRGTRPLPGVVDPWPMAAQRKGAIAASHKRGLTVLDFVGNSGNHKLVSTLDVLGGEIKDEVKKEARRIAETKDGEVDWEKIVDEAKRELAKRARLKAEVQYSTKDINPFGWTKQAVKRKVKVWDPATVGQREALDSFRVEKNVINKLSKGEAGKLIDDIIRRSKMGLSTYRQSKVLSRFGYDCRRMTKRSASQLIDVLTKNGWRR